MSLVYKHSPPAGRHIAGAGGEMIDFRWKDLNGDIGSMFTAGGQVFLRLSEDPDEDEDDDRDPAGVQHRLSVSKARAIHEALGKALEEVDPKASQPEPHPTGNGDLVTPPLLERLSAHPELTALVLERDAFGRSKYGTGLRTHNGRNPLEDGRQEIGDLLQYLQQATMEGKDIDPLLSLCRDGLGVFDKPAPTLHPRPFWWDFDDGEFVAVDGGDNYLGIETVDDLLELAPNALDGRESRYPREPRELPSFGFRSEHTGPRTLREYLEAP